MHLRNLCFAAALACQASAAQTQPAPFAKLCAGCHGEAALGTERGPTLIGSRHLRRMTRAQIQDVIRVGTPKGMPPFALPGTQLQELATWVHSLNASAWDVQPPGDGNAGRAFFFGPGQCSNCHMVRGFGASNGPDLSDIGRALTMHDLEQALDDPKVRAGTRSTASCPSWAWCPQSAWTKAKVQMRDGTSLSGILRSQGKHDLQLQTPDGQFRLLSDQQYAQVTLDQTPLMPALRASPTQRRDLLAYLSRLDGIHIGPLTPAPASISKADQERILQPQAGEWPTYNGITGGNRHSALHQIDTNNVAQLRLAWTYSLPYSGLEMTPLVASGMMFISGPNQVCALDARTGREIWCYLRPRTPGGTIAGDAAKGANRGVAILGDRVFFATDNAHLICLNRITGGLMWEVPIPETPGRYGSTAAPLVVNDLVITGVAGGDEGIRGFVAAFHANTGELAWRFWTVPRPGETGSETWHGKAIDLGGASTWLTGTYDPETGLLFWPTGNPFPDTDGAERGGANLYTNCVVALDASTGKMRWHFQFTPHDLHDWDATEPPILVNTTFNGSERKLLLQGNRNGFFYVLDRTSGRMLFAKAFVKKLTWASGIAPDGTPQLVAGNEPTLRGNKTCPAVRGATNWYSTAFSPETRLFYIMAVEDCSIYKQSQLGGYEPYQDPSDPPEKYLRALDIETGRIAWEIPQVGAPEANYSGVLSTAGGLVFYGETGGGFAAVDSRTGKTLWHLETNQPWKASPMTYAIDGRQFVSIASGGNVLAFALPE